MHIYHNLIYFLILKPYEGIADLLNVGESTDLAIWVTVAFITTSNRKLVDCMGF